MAPQRPSVSCPTSWDGNRQTARRWANDCELYITEAAELQYANLHDEAKKLAWFQMRIKTVSAGARLQASVSAGTTATFDNAVAWFLDECAEPILDTSGTKQTRLTEYQDVVRRFATQYATNIGRLSEPLHVKVNEEEMDLLPHQHYAYQVERFWMRLPSEYRQGGAMAAQQLYDSLPDIIKGVIGSATEFDSVTALTERLKGVSKSQLEVPLGVEKRLEAMERLHLVASSRGGLAGTSAPKNQEIGGRGRTTFPVTSPANYHLETWHVPALISPSISKRFGITMEEKRLYADALKEFKSRGQTATPARPFPLTPGTRGLADMDCFRCGQGWNRSHQCGPELAVNSLEQTLRRKARASVWAATQGFKPTSPAAMLADNDEGWAFIVDSIPRDQGSALTEVGSESGIETTPASSSYCRTPGPHKFRSNTNLALDRCFGLVPSRSEVRKLWQAKSPQRRDGLMSSASKDGVVKRVERGAIEDSPLEEAQHPAGTRKSAGPVADTQLSALLSELEADNSPSPTDTASLPSTVNAEADTPDTVLADPDSSEVEQKRDGNNEANEDEDTPDDEIQPYVRPHPTAQLPTQPPAPTFRDFVIEAPVFQESMRQKRRPLTAPSVRPADASPSNAKPADKPSKLFRVSVNIGTGTKGDPRGDDWVPIARGISDEAAAAILLDEQFYREHAGHLGALQESELSFRCANGSLVRSQGSVMVNLQPPGHVGSTERCEVVDSNGAFTLLLSKGWKEKHLAVHLYGWDALLLANTDGTWTVVPNETVGSAQPPGDLPQVVRLEEATKRYNEWANRQISDADRRGAFDDIFLLAEEANDQAAAATTAFAVLPGEAPPDIVEAWLSMTASGGDNITQSRLTPEEHADRWARVEPLLQIGDPKNPQFLSNSQEKQAKELCREFADIFATNAGEVTQTHLAVHRIPTQPGARPYRAPIPRPLPPPIKDWVDSQVDSLADATFIKPMPTSETTWVANISVAPKAYESDAQDTKERIAHVRRLLEEGTHSLPAISDAPPEALKKWRMCIAYNRLNGVTQSTSFPSPALAAQIAKLAGCTVYCKLDCAMGFHAVLIAEEDIPKTAFYVPGRGVYAWVVMPFGLKGAPGTYVEVIMRAYHDLLKEIANWFDDIAAGKKGPLNEAFNDLLDLLCRIFTRSREANICLAPAKCKLFTPSISWCGKLVNSDGIQSDPQKVLAIMSWPIPQTPAQMLSFLQSAGYHRDQIPNFAALVDPLLPYQKPAPLLPGDKRPDGSLRRQAIHDALQRVPPGWDLEADSAALDAFRKVKLALCSSPVLQEPIYDGRGFIVSTDGSGVGYGAELSQRHTREDGKIVEKPIAYASRRTMDREKRYDPLASETSAAIWGLDRFRSITQGSTITLKTDCYALTKTLFADKLTPAHERWRQRFFNHDVIATQHVEGRHNALCDGLSRLSHLDPIPEDTPGESALEAAGFEDLSWEEAMAKRPKSLMKPTSIDGVATVAAMGANTASPGATDPARLSERSTIDQDSLLDPTSPGTSTPEPEQEPLADHGDANDEKIRTGTADGSSPAGQSQEGPGEPEDATRIAASRSSLMKPTSIDGVATVAAMGANTASPGATDPAIPSERPTIGQDALLDQIPLFLALSVFLAADAPSAKRLLERYATDTTWLPALQVLLSADLSAFSETARAHARRLARQLSISDDGELIWTKPDGSRRMVIPKTEVEQLILKSHALGGHFGRDLTVADLKQKYHWLSVWSDVARVLQTCEICQRYGPQQRAWLLRPIVPLAPFDLVFFDTVHISDGIGKLNGRVVKKMGVAVDGCTTYVWGLPILTESSATGVKMLEMIAKDGRPKVVVVDGGSPFRGPEFEAKAKEINCVIHATPPFVPSANGLVERANQLVIDRLRRLTPPEEVDRRTRSGNVTKGNSTWLFEIEGALTAINERVPPSLKYAPKELVSCWRPVSQPPTAEDIRDYRVGLLGTTPEMAALMLTLREAKLDDAVANRKEAAERMEAKHNRLQKHTVASYSLGDIVGVADLTLAHQHSRKLEPRWNGPFRIHAYRDRQDNSSSFQVKSLDGSTVHPGWIHVKRLRPWHSTPTPMPVEDAFLSEESPWDDFLWIDSETQATDSRMDGDEGSLSFTWLDRLHGTTQSTSPNHAQPELTRPPPVYLEASASASRDEDELRACGARPNYEWLLSRALRGT